MARSGEELVPYGWGKLSELSHGRRRTLGPQRGQPVAECALLQRIGAVRGIDHDQS
jgi:hypothetical protein